MSQVGIYISFAVVTFFLVIGGVAANYFVTKKDTVPEIEIARIVEHVRSAVVQRSNRAKQTPTFHRKNIAVAECRIINERKIHETGFARYNANC